jgi:hypothetical protein
MLIEGSEGKRLLERPGRRWDDDIKLDLSEMGHQDVEWIFLAQDWLQSQVLVIAEMNLLIS